MRSTRSHCSAYRELELESTRPSFDAKTLLCRSYKERFRATATGKVRYSKPGDKVDSV